MATIRRMPPEFTNPSVPTSAADQGNSGASGSDSLWSKIFRNFVKQTQTSATDRDPASATLTANSKYADAEHVGRRPNEAAHDAGEIYTLAGIALHLKDIKSAEGGFRSLVAGATRGVDPTKEAMALASELSTDGEQVLLVDWSLDGIGCARAFGAAHQPGMMELLSGTAGFEDIITNLPGSLVHCIACGGAPAQLDVVLEPDELNTILDALDEVYDQIVIVGQFEAAQALFEAVQGRFDAGISIGEGSRARAVAWDGDGSFLEFGVADVDVTRYERPVGSFPSVLRRLSARHEAEVV